MKNITKLGVTLCMASAFCYAETFNGKLLDASCYDNSQGAAATTSTAPGHATGKLDKECAPTASTTNFAIETSNKKVYRLDSAGSAKAAAAMQSGELKADNDGDVHVSINGSMQGDRVSVDSLHSKKAHQ